MIGDFHFIRPWWLAALIPAVLLWWLLRSRFDDSRNWRRVIAPHLLPYLLSTKTGGSQLWPIDAIALSWLLTITAIAGPAWKREPMPFADDMAALSLVVKVTPSMTAADVQPSRLARGVEKIGDLLELRKGAKTSLIAYAGTAHVVMPTTTDSGIITTFAQALKPEIMPQDGDAVAEAFRLAEQTLAESGGGSILWIADNVAPEQVAALTAWQSKSTTTVRLLPLLNDGPELVSLEAAAKSVHAAVVRFTPDDADVSRLARATKFVAAAPNEQSTRWREAGYWLCPWIALMSLVFFRRGWMAPTAAR